MPAGARVLPRVSGPIRRVAEAVDLDRDGLGLPVQEPGVVVLVPGLRPRAPGVQVHARGRRRRGDVFGAAPLPQKAGAVAVPQTPGDLPGLPLDVHVIGARGLGHHVGADLERLAVAVPVIRELGPHLVVFLVPPRSLDEVDFAIAFRGIRTPVICESAEY